MDPFTNQLKNVIGTTAGMGALLGLGYISPAATFTQTLTTFGLAGVVGYNVCCQFSILSFYLILPLGCLGSHTCPTFTTNVSNKCNFRNDCSWWSIINGRWSCTTNYTTSIRSTFINLHSISQFCQNHSQNESIEKHVHKKAFG